MPHNPSPLVSILMLTYNRAHFIGEAIASVLAQTYTNFELIIIDDGSTDDTAEVVSRFTDPRITYSKETTNQGLLVRRQGSLSRAQGAYIAVLDSDDIWLEVTKLAQQVTYLEANPECSIVGTFFKRIDTTGRELGTHSYATTDTAIRHQLLWDNQFIHSSVLMRTQHLQKTAGYRFPLAEDFDLFLQLGTVGTLANLPLYATAYRVHTSSESNKKVALMDEALKITKQHKAQYPGYYKAWLKFTLYRLFLKLI